MYNYNSTLRESKLGYIIFTLIILDDMKIYLKKG